jgi:Beta-1,3-glucanase
MRLSSLLAAALALLLAAHLGAPAHAQAAPPLKLVFLNKSGFDSRDVSVGFVGSDTLTATNAKTGAALAPVGYKQPNWYTLDTLADGIDLTKFSARIYICYGSPWTVEYKGYEPSPANPKDPNYDDRYDKMEITYSGARPDVADTTSIDYFSIPITLRVYHGGVKDKLVGSVTASTTKVIVDALAVVTSPPYGAVVKDKSGAFIRVIGPGAYPPPPGLPASPYDNFEAYLRYLEATYAPAHGGVLALIKGHFAGVGKNPTTPETKPQDYDFAATIDAQLDITLSGSGSVVGKHTLLFRHADLVAPTGIYGANPAFSLDGGSPIHPANDVYGWLVADLLSGLNIGAVGSTVKDGSGGIVGGLPSQQWFKLPKLFSALQPAHADYYNRYSAALTPVSQAYGFAYSDRFAHPVATLNPGAPAFVDTLQIELMPEQ